MYARSSCYNLMHKLLKVTPGFPGKVICYIYLAISKEPFKAKCLKYIKDIAIAS